MNNKPRLPWLAALLTLLITGLGHIYAGNKRRGLILFSIAILLGILFSIFILVVPNIYFIIVFIVGAFAFYVFCILDAFLVAKRNNENYERAKYNKWFVYVGYFFFLLFISNIVSLIEKATLSEAYRMPARSMAPTLLIGDHFLINKFIYGVKIPLSRKTIIPVTDPKRDDIVVFIYPNDRSKDFVKRVIGVGGDKIEIINKKIFINDTEYKDAFGYFSDNLILPKSLQPRDNFGPVIVPKNSIFVMGDNRDESLDSRFWGFVDLKDVEGKVYMIYWSWNSDEHKVRWKRFGHYLK